MKVVLGVYGETLADSVFMRPSEHSTLMEFFPSGIFNRDAEISAHSLGVRYMGWWNDQYALLLCVSILVSLILFSGSFKVIVFLQSLRDMMKMRNSG
jgi:hypothetical protein